MRGIGGIKKHPNPKLFPPRFCLLPFLTFSVIIPSCKTGHWSWKLFSLVKEDKCFPISIFRYTLYKFLDLVLSHIYTDGKENNESRSERIHDSVHLLLNFYFRIIEEFLPRPKITHLSHYDVWRRTYMPYFNIYC